jgi:uncharacterized membrane protein YhaH (DUF805 family)
MIVYAVALRFLGYIGIVLSISAVLIKRSHDSSISTAFTLHWVRLEAMKHISFLEQYNLT